MSKKNKKHKAVKPQFPSEIIVRMDDYDGMDALDPFMEVTEKSQLNPDDKVATYKLVLTGRVKQTLTIEKE